MTQWVHGVDLVFCEPFGKGGAQCDSQPLCREVAIGRSLKHTKSVAHKAAQKVIQTIAKDNKNTVNPVIHPVHRVSQWVHTVDHIVIHSLQVPRQTK